MRGLLALLLILSGCSGDIRKLNTCDNEVNILEKHLDSERVVTAMYGRLLPPPK